MAVNPELLPHVEGTPPGRLRVYRALAIGPRVRVLATNRILATARRRAAR